jgi:circadian clock protein KaiB
MKRKPSTKAGVKPQKKRKAVRALKYSMRLFVTGATPRSSAAIMNLRKLCEEYLPGQYELKIVDLYQHPEMASQGLVIAAPTLVKFFPLPLRRFIGDMSNKANLLRGLDINPMPATGPGTGPGKE